MRELSFDRLPVAIVGGGPVGLFDCHAHHPNRSADAGVLYLGQWFELGEAVGFIELSAGWLRHVEVQRLPLIDHFCRRAAARMSHCGSISKAVA